MKKTIRIVIDTNIWISYLIGQTLAHLTDNIINKQIKILFSDELMAELIEVLHRPRFSKYFSSDAIQELVALIDANAEYVQISTHVNVCRDEKDNFILDLCLAGNADYLVTGDSDLLALHPYNTTKIIDYRSFENIIDRL